ncbi:nucleotidyltransferase family protein [Microbacter margulisiae]|uniref:NDP-sugar pyrophosphorylase family protein n=1 Tax=Microbacter margulisiae TaxID=1350067 RepID=A0A7W5DN16_9PORP|nr:nucleotidyltransferase family protein [Microbacter margulisiae]MBB3185861.1 NDP-sugar pyrophosphorylase family protein [Microbacter margulisiae]
MKALVVAAGLGTRLRPLTDSIPKALVPINGVPLLEHVCNKLISAGFDEIIINVHHFADQIIEFVQTKKQFGIHIEISDERDQLLDTGGAIKKATWFFDDNQPFLVHNVDIISTVNLNEMYQYHQTRHADATLLTSDRPTNRYLLFDRAMQLKGWTNIHTQEVKSSFDQIDISALSRLAFGGIQIISPNLLKLMASWPDRFSVIDFYLSAAQYHSIISYQPMGISWFDVGKIESLQKVESWLSAHL